MPTNCLFVNFGKKLLGIIVFIFCTLGLWFAGKLADNYTQKGYKDGKTRACLCLITGLLVTCWIFPLLPTGEWAAWAIIPVDLFSASPTHINTQQ